MNSPLVPFDLDRVALGVFHREVLESDTRLAGDQQTLAARPLSLVLEAQDGFVRPWPRIVTELSSRESVAVNSNCPVPNSMISPALALIIAVWACFGASGPASIRVTLGTLEPAAGRTGRRSARSRSAGRNPGSKTL